MDQFRERYYALMKQICFKGGYYHGHRHEPIYLTTGPSTLDTYHPAASQKTKSIHQAANVLRNLIQKLPDRDLKQHLTDYASLEQPIEFSVHDQPPFKNLPASINSLSFNSDHSSYADSVPPPPEANPESYKVYRAMAAKLAGVTHPSQKKPYLILNDDVHPTQDILPFSTHNPSNFEIQKTIQYSFHDPPQYVVQRHGRNDAKP